MGNNNFSEFTNLYEISKTLRFELKPLEESEGVSRTKKLLEKNGVFEKDKIVNESYHKIKPFLDILHRIFIDESLKNTKLDFNLAYEKFLEIEKTAEKKQKDILRKELDTIKIALRKELVQGFKTTGEKWKNYYGNNTYTDEKGKEKKYPIKGDSYKILMAETNINILYQYFSEEKYGNEVLVKNYDGKKQNKFKIFQGFTTYFTNFNLSRENFYKDDGKAGRIATRIIDENMIFFFKNKKHFDEKYKNNEILQHTLQQKLENYGETRETFFCLENYNKCFTGELILYYNIILGDLNSIVNLEKQAQFSKHKQAKKQGNENESFKKQNFPLFKELYKQILSKDEEENKYIEIESFSDIKKHLNEFLVRNKNYTHTAKTLISSLSENSERYELAKVFLSKLALTTLSAKFFGSHQWSLIQDYLLKDIGYKNKNSRWEIPDFVSLESIKKALEGAQKECAIEDKKELFKDEFVHIASHDIFVKFLTIFSEQFNKNISDFETNITRLEKDIFTQNDFDKDDHKKEQQVLIIKSFLDSCLNIFRMMKYFALEKGKESIKHEYQDQIDETFYNTFEKYYIDNPTIHYYNAFRNYLTQKPYSSNKIKLNFENGTLLDGWDKNKEPDNFGTLLRKDGKYYLALQIYGKKNIFYKKKGSSVIDIEEAFTINTGEEKYEKIDYKFLPDPKKMLPKVCFAKSNAQIFHPSDEILDIKANETFKTGEKFQRKDFEKIVNYYKECLKKYPDWQVFDFHFSDTKAYQNLSDFYKEIEVGSYYIGFREVSQKYIFENIEKGNIYFFEIYNQDFAKTKTGKENLHTSYFKGLFEDNNLKNIVLKLNGKAEIFRRESSIEKKIDAERKVKIDVIIKKRYTEDKLFFHCPIKLNFAKYDTGVNQKILNYISSNKEINIIGIDRGEKHLAYFSVINRKGEVLKDKNGNLLKGSLNEIEKSDKAGKALKTTNYYSLLDKKQKERKEAKINWKTIENIKDLKKGYISQLVYKLATLVIEYNAIIVFEDLNVGFKRGRQKIEKQVYQNLEKALIEKLNYLTFKNKNIGEAGNYLRAYQLTAPFTTFEKMGKQTGIIFYTDPSYTSSTCPQCGFRKDLYIKYSNLVNARKDISQIDSITFENNIFAFEYNNKKVFSNRDRKKNFRNPENNNYWETQSYDVTEHMKELLDEFRIDYKKGGNIKEAIIEKNEKQLYAGIFYNFNIILSLRNSIIGDNSRYGDFIACPCCDFDTRRENNIGIENGDDNGAYNIARKGMIILDKIDLFLAKNGKLDGIKWADMGVTKDEWDKFCEINRGQ